MDSKIQLLLDKSKKYFSVKAVSKRTQHENDLLELVSQIFESIKLDKNKRLAPQELILKVFSHQQWPWVEQDMIQTLPINEWSQGDYGLITKREIHLLVWDMEKAYLLKCICPHRLPGSVFYFLTLCTVDLFVRAGLIFDKIDSKTLFFEKLDGVHEPILILEESGELIFSNPAFSSLGLLPKDCLRINDDENIEANFKIYKVKKSVTNHKDGQYHILVFLDLPSITIQDRDKMNEFSDLGIITSSIAHELNNPIAGILACLQVIETDKEFWSNYAEQLEEMQRSAVHCRELVKIFLNFSKENRPDDAELSFWQCFEHAKLLLRSRMIESNVVIAVKHEKRYTGLEFKPKKSASMVMALYLILNEVLTAISKNSLLEWSPTTRSRHMSLDIIEKNDEVLFKMDKKGIEIDLGQPLLQHLMAGEGMQIDIAEDVLRMKKGH